MSSLDFSRFLLQNLSNCNQNLEGLLDFDPPGDGGAFLNLTSKQDHSSNINDQSHLSSGHNMNTTQDNNLSVLKGAAMENSFTQINQL